MPRPIMDLNAVEYHAMLLARDLHKTYGRNYKDMIWAEATLERLQARMPDGDYTDADRADFAKAKTIIAFSFTGIQEWQMA